MSFDAALHPSNELFTIARAWAAVGIGTLVAPGGSTGLVKGSPTIEGLGPRGTVHGRTVQQRKKE